MGEGEPGESLANSPQNSYIILGVMRGNLMQELG